MWPQCSITPQRCSGWECCCFAHAKGCCFDWVTDVSSLVLCILSFCLRGYILHIQVNADEHGPIGEKFGVRGFPTIKFFGRGKSTASPEE